MATRPRRAVKQTVSYAEELAAQEFARRAAMQLTQDNEEPAAPSTRRRSSASLDLEAGDGEALRDPLEALSDQLGAKDRRRVPVHEPSSKKTGFGARFDAVWGKIVDRCRSGSSYDAEALGAVSQTLGACARHDVVHCRHAGAAGAMEVGLAVAAAAAALEAQVASCAAQLEALGGGAKPKKGSKAEAVRKRTDDLEASLERLDELGEAIFDDVFCKRYRDVHARVRVAVVERLGKWIAARPAKYLDTRYLKYVAWVLDFPEGAERAAAAGALARAFGAVDDATREALGDFAARHLGEDDVADVTDKVYSKIVDEDAAPELRAACLGLALKYEDFDVARAGGDGAKTLHDLGRFVEASILGDDGPLALAPLAADAFLDLGDDSRALLQDWRAWVDVLGRDDVGTQSPQAAPVLAEAQDGVNGAKSLRSDLDRDAWAALHAAQLSALAVAAAAAGGLAHPGLRRKRGFAALALPVDDDRDLAALAADVVWRHGARRRGARAHAQALRVVVEGRDEGRVPGAPRPRAGPPVRRRRPPDTPQREDLFAAVLAVAAAAEESEILAAAAEALAAHPDDAATVHLRALDRVAALLGADDGDEDEHEAARDAVADLGPLAGARASFGDDAAAATDALHGVLHGASTRPSRTRPRASRARRAAALRRRRPQEREIGARDAGLRASVLRPSTRGPARSGARTAPTTTTTTPGRASTRSRRRSAAASPAQAPRAAAAGAGGTGAAVRRQAPPRVEPAVVGPVDAPRQDRRVRGRGDDAAPAPPRAESDSDDDPLPGGRRTYDAPPLLEPLAEDGADSDSDDEPIMPAARRAYSGDAGHITTDDDDDDADAADRKRRRSWMPAAPLEEEEDDDDDEDESPPPKKKPRAAP
ncbi:hypothetical protein JL722_12432 [Aureococcus anophagefferens]|nr:hypothetical protein JL722_12432 [Aureococcus anophagefferens]